MDSETENALLARAGAGDSEALSRLLAAHTSALARMIALRLDSRLMRRVVAADSTC